MAHIRINAIIEISFFRVTKLVPLCNDGKMKSNALILRMGKRKNHPGRTEGS
jgi:hypothetical protein